MNGNDGSQSLDTGYRQPRRFIVTKEAAHSTRYSCALVTRRTMARNAPRTTT